MNKEQTLAIITANLNGRSKLEALAASLSDQTDQNFDWIVADGGSNDGSVEFLKSLEFERLLVLIREDYGIYNGLNNALVNCSADYYLILGNDDFLYRNAVELVKSKIEQHSFDIGVFGVLSQNKRLERSRLPIMISGHKALVVEHAVGTVFRTDLHSRLGFYSRRFPIAADHEFILRCHFSNAEFREFEDVLGVYGDAGVSSTSKLQAMSESFVIQCAHFPLVVQLFMFAQRVLRYGLRRGKFSNV